MSESTIIDGKVVALHFTLTLPDGTVADTSGEDEPMLYMHGYGNIVPGLEKELTGKVVGDKLVVDVEPAEGFGDHDPRGVQEIPRSEFPDDVEFDVGMEFGFENPEDGDVQPGWVREFTAETVTIDLNHPLAGSILHFEVEVIGVREPTSEELEHGHPHGPGGMEHD
jgi:FKBP-type peptidyl-prolyl cis-trans isomerase SlyD